MCIIRLFVGYRLSSRNFWVISTFGVTSKTRCSFWPSLDSCIYSMQVSWWQDAAAGRSEPVFTYSMQISDRLSGQSAQIRRTRGLFAGALRQDPWYHAFSKRRRRAEGRAPLRVRAGGPRFYLPMSDGVRLTSSRAMMRMPNAFGRFSCPHSGSISNGLLHPSSSRG